MKTYLIADVRPASSGFGMYQCGPEWHTETNEDSMYQFLSKVKVRDDLDGITYNQIGPVFEDTNGYLFCVKQQE